jgi:CheY-like chemotaxis protein
VAVLGKAAPTSDTVVLLHSSLSAEVLRAKATSAGAHGFLQKSGDLFGLVREVNRWLKRVSSANMRAAPATSSDEKYPSGTRPTAIAATASIAAISAPPSSDSAHRSGDQRTSGTLLVEVPSVLLVDGDMSVLSAYRRTLQTEDLTIEFALSGTQALRRLLSDKPPDVVVCDMLLSDILGVEVYERAVAAEPSYRQRFAVVTGASGPPPVAAFLATFRGPVLYKPVEAGRLLATVRACLVGARASMKSSAGR